jgi:hypothetical protein
LGKIIGDDVDWTQTLPDLRFAVTRIGPEGTFNGTDVQKHHVDDYFKLPGASMIKRMQSSIEYTTKCSSYAICEKVVAFRRFSPWSNWNVDHDLPNYVNETMTNFIASCSSVMYNGRRSFVMTRNNVQYVSNFPKMRITATDQELEKFSVNEPAINVFFTGFKDNSFAIELTQKIIRIKPTFVGRPQGYSEEQELNALKAMMFTTNQSMVVLNRYMYVNESLPMGLVNISANIPDFFYTETRPGHHSGFQTSGPAGFANGSVDMITYFDDHSIALYEFDTRSGESIDNNGNVLVRNRPFLTTSFTVQLEEEIGHEPGSYSLL